MEIIDFIVSYGGWSWIVAGLVFLALELVVPGGFLLWLGVAGIVTGVATLFQPIPGPFQWVIFGALSIAAILLWMRFYKSRAEVSDRPLLNRRTERFVGQEAVLDEPIANGQGRVALGDTTWRVTGPNLAAGQRVRIVGSDGAVLRVEAI